MALHRSSVSSESWARGRWRCAGCSPGRHAAMTAEPAAPAAAAAAASGTAAAAAATPPARAGPPWRLAARRGRGRARRRRRSLLPRKHLYPPIPLAAQDAAGRGDEHQRPAVMHLRSITGGRGLQAADRRRRHHPATRPPPQTKARRPRHPPTPAPHAPPPHVRNRPSVLEAGQLEQAQAALV
jgi:hypothetical protein